MLRFPMRLRFPFACLLLNLAVIGVQAAPATAAGAATSSPVRVAENVSSTMVISKTPMQYPDAARQAGVQGTVVLKILVDPAGKVTEVLAISGEPTLAHAAIDAVKQWRYKPYIVNGAPVEMETQLSVKFSLKQAEDTTPSLGTFRDGTYSNPYFGFEYPLSQEWVRETEVMEKRLSAGKRSTGAYLLLAAVHIPEGKAGDADSSFVLWALNSDHRSCQQYLSSLADTLRSRKEAKQLGSVISVKMGGLDFERANFEYAESPSDHTLLCTQSKDYLLQWDTAGLSWSAVDYAVSTLKNISAFQPQGVASATPSSQPPSSGGTAPNHGQPLRVRVSQGVTQGRRIKAVQPVYPEAAKYQRISGQVVLGIVIDKNGNVTDLQVLDGPNELVASAVKAVRQWKYQPYVLKGQPVEVSTTITVNYTMN